MKIPCVVHTEVSKEDVVREVARAPWGNVSAVGAAQGMPDSVRAPDARSCSHADCDTAEECGVAGRGIPKGEECDPHSPRVRGAEAQLCG